MGAEIMTNRERLLETARTCVSGMIDLLSEDLALESYESLNKKIWDRYASALKSLGEAVDLLNCILYASQEVECDLDDLPPFSDIAINSYSACFGNRCYFQMNDINKWLKQQKDDSYESDDFRYDLDFDIIETTTTETTTETQTKTTRKSKTKRGCKK
jgi:hypothetical protein